MRSVLSRLSAASATSLMRSGRPSWPRVESPPSRGHRYPQLHRERWASNFGGVKKRHAALDRRPDQFDALLLVGCRTIAVAEAHAGFVRTPRGVGSIAYRAAGHPKPPLQPWTSI